MYLHQIYGSIYNIQTEYALKIRNKCIKGKDHERNTTCRPRVSGVQLGVTKSKGLETNTCVTVAIYVRCKV